MTSILRREEIVLLRTNHTPSVFRNYAEIINQINSLAEPIMKIGEDEIWLPENVQRRVLREMYREAGGLIQEGRALRDYIREILERLEETP